MTCRQLEKELAGDEWTHGNLTGLIAEDFLTWSKMDTIGYEGHDYSARDKCVDFGRALWLELGDCMCRKHWSVYQDHMKYVRNENVKPFKIKTLRYSENVCEMHEIAKCLPTTLINGEIAMSDKWNVRNEEFTTSDLRFSIKDGLPKSMRNELDDHTEDYCSLIKD